MHIHEPSGQFPAMVFLYLALAIWAGSGYYLRWVLRTAIPKYDIINEVYHPGMQIVMAYMFLPVERQIVGYKTLESIFIIFGVYYLSRVIYTEFIQSRIRVNILDRVCFTYEGVVSETTHAVLGFGTAYMFASSTRSPFADIIFTLFFVWVALKNIRTFHRDWSNTQSISDTKLTSLISSCFHIAMGASMALMNIWMMSSSQVT